MKSSLAFLALVLITVAGCATQAALEYFSTTNEVHDVEIQRPLTPGETVSHLIVPEGFEVSVFAAEPDIRNPIALTWDERGRLWVVESTDYPHDHIGTESGTDRITICEDTDGDYVADTFTHFAHDQPLTTAIAVTRGGAIVGQAPDIVFMEDTDGDDEYDRKTPILENAFGTFDTHAVMNNFKVGIDNHIWSAVGYSGMYEPGTAPDAESRILSRGVFRFSRDGAVLEPVGQFNNNTWGLGIGEDNTIFGSTANNNHAIVVGIPMRFGSERNVANVQSHYLVAHSGTRPLWQVDFRDGYTAAAGAFAYNGRTYPRFYWGTLMVTEPTAHVVHAVKLQRDGAIYKEQEGVIDNLLASSDDWVAPVFADIGPDENIWIADWYNPVIQHNPDRRGMVNQIWNANLGPGNAHLNPLRDKQHGRIYVVRYTGSSSDGPKSLSADDPDALLRALRSSNQFWRLTAQRLIVEHQLTGLVEDLVAMAGAENLDETGFDGGAVHALWTLHGLGASEALRSAASAALTHASAAVRKAAIQTIPYSADLGELLAASGVFTDPNLNTRLAAVLLVAEYGHSLGPRAFYASREAANGGDQWIQAALDLFPAYIGTIERPREQGAMQRPQDAEPSLLPQAHIRLGAPEGVMRFDKTALRAFASQPITVTFDNLHPDLHNAVFLQPGDMEPFGQAVNAYMADADAAQNEYIPPSEQSRVLASSGVLEMDQSKDIMLGPLAAGEYPFVCTVPGHWAVMQGILTVTEAPPMPRNDAGWVWPGTEGTIVYLAGSASRGQQSHHHARVFGFADGQVLYGEGARTYIYTENADMAFREALFGADLLAMANNKPVDDLISRQAILAHVEAGRPLLVTHPASWYNWADWPEWNATLVGGGARSHEPLQEFTVEVLQPEHPLMKDVPASFDIFDELYRAELLPEAEAVVLAIGRSKETGAIYPVVWLRRHAGAKILVNTLGHDDRAHNLAAYKQILRNARAYLLDE